MTARVIESCWTRRTIAAATAVGTMTVAACSMRLPRTVDVRVSDDAVRAPATVPPGPALVHLTNASASVQGIRVVTFRQGISPDSARALLGMGVYPDSLREPSEGTLVAEAQRTATPQLYVELLSGRVYGFVALSDSGRVRYAVLVAQEEKKQ